jgi:polyphosphate kinase
VKIWIALSGDGNHRSASLSCARDADMMIQEMEASDLLETMELSVRQRRFGNVVRDG